MGKKWRQLKYEDRLKIYAWLQDKTSVATIAKRLGVCRQTIYREIKRGEFVKRNTDYTESIRSICCRGTLSKKIKGTWTKSKNRQ